MEILKVYSLIKGCWKVHVGHEIIEHRTGAPAEVACGQGDLAREQRGGHGLGVVREYWLSSYQEVERRRERQREQARTRQENVKSCGKQQLRHAKTHARTVC